MEADALAELPEIGIDLQHFVAGRLDDRKQLGPRKQPPAVGRE
jgi:hypothetical protein